ncbi:21013_t:CDS:10 [Entrophospora sp. SA101]|nr:21013_t:CDS:10 [Entrophospora sp. SA101]
MKIITLLHSKYKAAYWSENILLKLSKPKNIPKDTELIVRCWDNRVKGRDGILTEIKINLIKLDPHENKVKLISKDHNYEINFEVYYILNENPKASSKILNDLKLKKNVADLSGIPGRVEIKFDDEIHSTKDHYKTVKPTKWKYPISFLIKHSSNILTITQRLSLLSHTHPHISLKLNSYSSTLEKKFCDDLSQTGFTKSNISKSISSRKSAASSFSSSSNDNSLTSNSSKIQLLSSFDNRSTSKQSSTRIQQKISNIHNIFSFNKYKIYTGKNIRNDDIVIIKVFSNRLLWENEIGIIKKLNNLSIDKFNTLKFTRELFLNICKGVQFLHKNGIVVGFSAPELVLNLNSDSISHYAIDIYSLGCLLYYLVTKKLFYTTTTNNLLLVKLDKIKEKISREINDDIINVLIIRMLNFMFIKYTLYINKL